MINPDARPVQHPLFVDLSANPRIAALTQVLREVSSVKDPAEMLKAFGPWVGQRFPRDAFVSISVRDLPEGHYKITRSITYQGEQTMNPAPSGNPWRDWEKLETHQGGVIGQVLARGEPAVLTGFDLASDPVLSEALGAYASKLHSLTAMPTFDDGEPLNWALSFHEQSNWADLDTFVAGLLDMNMMGTATRNLVFRKQAETLNEQLMEQFEQIAKIQRQLLPEKAPKLNGFTLATSYLTSTIAGGDYYDYFQGDDDRIGIVIADVSGHGPGAATVMAMLRAILHCYQDTLDNPSNVVENTAEIARYCNRKLVEANLNGEFATAFFCVLDPHTGRISWTRCGHNPPIIRRADGSIELLESAGTLPLGIVDTIEFESDACVMEPGDTLILYTDGITEASLPRHPEDDRDHEMFGVERMMASLDGCTGQPQCAIDSIHKGLFAYTKQLEREDDQTLVVVQRTGLGT